MSMLPKRIAAVVDFHCWLVWLHKSRYSRRLPFQAICSLIALLIASGNLLAFGEDNLANVYARVRQSIALVARPVNQRSMALGTAFCIFSDSAHSIYLTNRHVVGTASKVFLVVEGSNPIQATVLGTSKNQLIDAAIIDAPVPGVASLTFSASPLHEGDEIAIAGYPASQIDVAKAGFGYTQSVHRGTISALPADKLFIEYDAHSEHGNSGSPVFDPESGAVYGMETWGFSASGAVNVAIATRALQPFLEQSGIKLSLQQAASSRAPSPPAVDRSRKTGGTTTSCKQALPAVQTALSAWRTAALQILDDEDTLTSATKALNLRDHDSVERVLAATHTELGAVDYLTHFVEPNLQAAKAAMDATGAVQTAKYVDGMVDVIMEDDYYTHQRLQLLADYYTHIYMGDRKYKIDRGAFENVVNGGVEASSTLVYALRAPYPKPCAD